MDDRAPVRFGPFALDPLTLELTRDRQPVPLPRQPASVLLLLARRSGEIVTRKEILETCWYSVPYVEDATVNAAIRQIRRALGDSPASPRYLETLPKRGYRLLAQERPRRSTLRIAAELALAGAMVMLVSGGHGSRPTRSAAARLEYAKGEHFLQAGKMDSAARSVEHFQRAVALDDEYAEAYAGLADAQLHLGEWKAARRSAERAHALDADSARAHFVLGHADWFDRWDLTSAERRIRRAAQLDRTNTTFRVGLAFLLVSTGRAPEAVDVLRSAEAIDPLKPAIRSDAGVAYFLARHYDDAVRQCALAVEIDPASVWAEDCAMDALARLGRAGEAVARIEPALRRWQIDTRALDWLREDRPEKILHAYRSWRVQRMEQRGFIGFYAATFYAELNMPDRTVDALERAIQTKDFMLLTLEEDPRFDQIRSDSRFQTIVRRVNTLRSGA